MESNDLLADHVLASLEVGGDGAVPLSTGGDQVVRGPGVRGAVVASLVDLGPDGSVAVILEVLGDVGADGALVRRGEDVVPTAVVVPLQGNGVSSGGADEVAGSCGTVDVADNVGAGHVLDGVVGGGRPNVGACAIALEFTVDPSSVDTGVSRG